MSGPSPDDLVKFMNESTVSIATLRGLVGGDLSERRWNLMLWHAIQLMRERHGLEFIRQGDALVVAKPEQALRRGLRFNRTAVRKVKRSLSVLGAVDGEKLTPEEKATLERAVGRIGRTYNFAVAAARERGPAVHELPAATRPETARKIGEV